VSKNSLDNTPNALEFAMIPLTTHSGYEIFNYVQIITYIRLPNVNAYTSQEIFTFSPSLLGHILEDNLQLT